MPDLPCLTASQAIKAFAAAGFEQSRKQKGSHITLKRPGHALNLTIPVHKGKTLGKGLLRSLIADAGLTVDEFLNLCK